MQFFITITIAVLGYIIARALKVPVAAMMGSMFLVGLYNGFFDMAYTPSYLIIIIHAIAGAFRIIKLRVILT